MPVETDVRLLKFDSDGKGTEISGAADVEG